LETIQRALAVNDLISVKKALIWEEINVLKPEFRRVSKERAEARGRVDATAMSRIDFRFQSVLKQLKRLVKAAKSIQ
jgi:hypothetical protein